MTNEELDYSSNSEYSSDAISSDDSSSSDSDSVVSGDDKAIDLSPIDIMRQAARAVSSNIKNLPTLQAGVTSASAVQEKMKTGKMSNALQDALIQTIKNPLASFLADKTSSDGSDSGETAEPRNKRSRRGQHAGPGIPKLSQSSTPGIIQFASESGSLPAIASGDKSIPTLASSVGTALSKAVPIVDKSNAVEAPLLNSKPARTKKSDQPTAGKKWFDLSAPTLTPELKRELMVIKNRAFLDPKRHYKGSDAKRALPKYFAIGTVVEGPHERRSSTARLSNADRKATIVDGLMQDEVFSRYATRTLNTVAKRGMDGGKGAYNALVAKRRKGSAGAVKSFKKRK